MYYEYTSTTKQVLRSVKTVLTSTILQEILILQLKSKHDSFNNDIVPLLMTFESGFKIFQIQIHMSRRK